MCVHGGGFNIFEHMSSLKSPSALSLQITRSKGFELSVLELLGRSTGTTLLEGTLVIGTLLLLLSDLIWE